MFKLHRHPLQKTLVASCLIALSPTSIAQEAEIEIHLNRRHEVGGVSTFDRSKFITLHSDSAESDWQHGMRGENNASDDLLADFMIGRDVYFGRNSGYITYQIKNLLEEDPEKPGWARPSGSNNAIEERGQIARQTYEDKPQIHSYENRADNVAVAQIHPFWPDGTNTNNGWAFSQTNSNSEPLGSATGDYMGRFIENFYDDGGNQSGPPKPKYIEVINEPDWDLIQNGTTPPADIWNFHNTVATQIRSHSSDLLIGGYTTAFPDPDNNDFGEWRDEFKTFIDISGDHMDFWSIHLYDFPLKGGEQTYRKGSRLEAMFDIIDYYSESTLGEAKPYIISEYASQIHDLKNQAWSPRRDWLIMKGISSMMMSFMDRPHLMIKTIPFIVVKAEWGRNLNTGSAYNPRLMRQANEPESYTGEWVYTEIVKFYDLWSQVKGTRVDIVSSDIDIQVDAYVDGNKAFVALNNLVPNSNDEKRSITLQLSELLGNEVQSVLEKSLYWDGSTVQLEETNHTTDISMVEIGSEGSVILEYTFADTIEIDEKLQEHKFFASEYLQEIEASNSEVFHIENLPADELQRAELRIGFGRSNTLSKQPSIRLNGTLLTTPSNIMGRETDDRDNFFGMLHLSIPPESIQENNTVEIEFPDQGGHISTVAIRTFTNANDNSNGYQTWIQTFDLQEHQMLESADPDKDGFTNFYEYATSGDPTNPLHRGLAPQFEITKTHIEFTHVVRDNDSSINYKIESSETLQPQSWHPLETPLLNTTNAPPGFTLLTNEIPLADEPQFIRLRIEKK